MRQGTATNLIEAPLFNEDHRPHRGASTVMG